jgi:putative transcriptional regulator
MPDPTFARTVVLMGYHGPEGALGWIVNRALEQKAVDVLPDALSATVHPETPLRFGGPVEANGLVAVSRRDISGVSTNEVCEGIWVSGSPAVLPRLFASPPTGTVLEGLLVLGHSGWGPGQLEKEMGDGSWLVSDFDLSLAFARDASELWERALARLGISPGAVSASGGRVN